MGTRRSEIAFQLELVRQQINEAAKNLGRTSIVSYCRELELSI